MPPLLGCVTNCVTNVRDQSGDLWCLLDAELGAGSWSAHLGGLPASGPATDLARAVTACYAANPTTIVLGLGGQLESGGLQERSDVWQHR